MLRFLATPEAQSKFANEQIRHRYKVLKDIENVYFEVEMAFSLELVGILTPTESPFTPEVEGFYEYDSDKLREFIDKSLRISKYSIYSIPELMSKLHNSESLERNTKESFSHVSEGGAAILQGCYELRDELLEAIRASYE